MSEISYFYRASGVSWWILIKIDCVASKLDEYNGSKFQVSDRLYFSHDKHLVESAEYTDKINESFYQGLKLISDDFSKVVKEPTIVRVVSMDWLPSDFQTEAFGYGLASWIIKEYQLDVALPNPDYDNERQRYTFPYYIED